MTFTGEFLSCSRRHSVNEFNAALDAEYAGRVAAGTMARCVPVLVWSVKNSGFALNGGCVYYITLVSVFLLIKNGRNFTVKSTKQVKFKLISEWN